MSESRFDLASDSPVSIMREQVARGERVLWADRAVAGRSLWAALKLAMFGLGFAGFAAGWMALAHTMTNEDAGIWAWFPLFGVPFVVVGLCISVSPIWLLLRRSATVYGLTDRRIIVMVGRRGRLTRSVEIGSLGDLQVRERADHCGDIRFSGVARGSSLIVPVLFGVPNVRRVAEHIERLRDDLRRARADEASSNRPHQ